MVHGAKRAGASALETVKPYIERKNAEEILRFFYASALNYL